MYKYFLFLVLNSNVITIDRYNSQKQKLFGILNIFCCGEIP